MNIWLRQEGSDWTTYALVIGQYKNGNDKAVVFTSYDGSTAGKPKIATTARWYPVPEGIAESDVPEAIRRKIQARAS